MLFNIYNARMQKVSYVDAIDKADALKHAKRTWPGAAVERVLSERERQQRNYDEAEDLWRAMNPGHR